MGLVILWEEHIGVLEERAIYLLIGFLVREYSCKKYFSMAKDGCSMMVCEDIGDVKMSNDDAEDEDDESRICDATVVAGFLQTLSRL